MCATSVEYCQKAVSLFKETDETLSKDGIYWDKQLNSRSFPGFQGNFENFSRFFSKNENKNQGNATDLKVKLLNLVDITHPRFPRHAFLKHLQMTT